MNNLKRATEVAPNWGKAWHHYALFNVAALDHFTRVRPEDGKT